MDHQHPNDRPQIGVAAEGLCGGIGDQNGQEYVCCIGKKIGEHVDGARDVNAQKAVVHHEVQRLHDAHEEAAGHNGGDDGDEDVAQALDGPLEYVLFGGGGGLDLLLGGGGEAGNGDKLVIDLVHRACAQNDLELSRGAEDSLDPVDVLHGLGIALGVVCQHQPEPGGAVGGGNQVFSFSYLVVDLLGCLLVIHGSASFPVSISAPAQERMNRAI